MSRRYLMKLAGVRAATLAELTSLLGSRGAAKKFVATGGDSYAARGTLGEAVRARFPTEDAFNASPLVNMRDDLNKHIQGRSAARDFAQEASIRKELPALAGSVVSAPTPNTRASRRVWAGKRDDLQDAIDRMGRSASYAADARLDGDRIKQTLRIRGYYPRRKEPYTPAYI